MHALMNGLAAQCEGQHFNKTIILLSNKMPMNDIRKC